MKDVISHFSVVRHSNLLHVFNMFHLRIFVLKEFTNMHHAQTSASS